MSHPQHAESQHMLTLTVLYRDGRADAVTSDYRPHAGIAAEAISLLGHVKSVRLACQIHTDEVVDYEGGRIVRHPYTHPLRPSRRFTQALADTSPSNSRYATWRVTDVYRATDGSVTCQMQPPGKSGQVRYVIRRPDCTYRHLTRHYSADELPERDQYALELIVASHLATLPR